MTLTLVLLERPGRAVLHHPGCGYLKLSRRTTGWYKPIRTSVAGEALRRALRRRRVTKCRCIDVILEYGPK